MARPDIALLPFACPPAYRAEIGALLERFRAGLDDLLGVRLLALYVYGSLARGGFDPDRSDIDMLAVLDTSLTEEEGRALERLHRNLVAEPFRRWDDRIEVQYAHREGLRRFRDSPFRMANISPGEPFHFIRADRAWTCNWYFAQEDGLTLLERGVTRTGITDPPVSVQEFVDAVRDSVAAWRQNVQNTRRSRPYQGYAILTLSRALYTVATGRQISKPAAMEWVCETHPEWAEAVRAAWTWREQAGELSDPEETWPLTERTIREMADFMVPESSGT